MKYILTALVGMFSVAAMAATLQPDFKGLPLGSSMADVIAKFPEFYCRATPGGELGDTSCSLSPETKCLLEQRPYPDGRSCREAVEKAMTYAGVRADISLYFYSDRLSMVRVTFDAREMPTVVAALQEKFGDAATKRSEPVTNRMGVVFENQVLEWKGSGASMQAEKYAARVDRSSVKIFLDAYFGEFEKRKAVKAQRGAKDL